MDGLRLAAILATAGGLVLLYVGLADASPLAFFATAEEREARERGQLVMVAATAVLALIAAFVLSRGASGRAVLIAAPGLVSTALAYAFPDAGYSWLAFLPLAPAALAAALTVPRRD